MAFKMAVPEKYKEDGGMPPKGRYHLRIRFQADDFGDKGEMVVRYEVLASSVKDVEGTEFEEKFSKDNNMLWKILRLAQGIGIVTADQIRDAKKNGTELDIDFEGCVGKQLLAELTESEDNQGRLWVNVASYHTVDDKRCASWPKNAAMLEAIGIKARPDTPPADNKSGGGEDVDVSLLL